MKAYLKRLKRKEGVNPPAGSANVWVKSKSISPLTLYCYLKARFGPPMGISMMLRNSSTDNFIQWHYTLAVADQFVEVMARNDRIEIWAKSESALTENDWGVFESQLLRDFERYRVPIETVKSLLEHWMMFINPYRRLNMMLAILRTRILAV
jgi:hypothetical protein